MPRSSLQAPAAVVMIRPHHFAPNPVTARDNHFQSAAGPDAAPGHAPDRAPDHTLARAAHAEVTAAAAALREAGIRVHLFEDTGTATPDSVFPNNWFSTHAGGHVAVYPMHAPNRRAERRQDILEMLKRDYRVQDIIDYSGLEQDGLFLEGTGAMVIDHLERVAYAARSQRTSDILLERFCTHFNYEPMVFDATDARGRPIYHTNVLMCIGTDVALIGLEAITDAARRAEISTRLRRDGRDIIALRQDQIADFAGNAIELQGRDGLVLALSCRALAALDAGQRATLERHVRLLALDIPVIERAGGSVRCMIAGLHLSARPARPTPAADPGTAPGTAA